MNDQHARWVQTELIYRERYEKNVPFISRQEKEPDLPPSAIPGKVWFQKPLFSFGQHLIEFNPNKPPHDCLEGYVIGMNWDEQEWEYTLIGEANIPFIVAESELEIYDSGTTYELTVFKDLETDLWVFNDPERHLSLEPFVAGMDIILDRMTVLTPNAKAGFIFRFSDRPFISQRGVLLWEQQTDFGNWYFCPQFGMRGWLCAALYDYYNPVPKAIYIEAVALPTAPNTDQPLLEVER